MVNTLTHTKGKLSKLSKLSKLEIHTGVFLPQGRFGEGWADPLRKLRLAPMSFLASQDLSRVKLHVWSNVAPENEALKQVCGGFFRKGNPNIKIQKVVGSPHYSGPLTRYPQYRKPPGVRALAEESGLRRQY